MVGTGFEGGPFNLDISVPECPPVDMLSTDVRLQVLQLDESGVLGNLELYFLNYVLVE